MGMWGGAVTSHKDSLGFSPFSGTATGARAYGLPGPFDVFFPGTPTNDAFIRSVRQIAEAAKGVATQSSGFPPGFWSGPKGAEEWGRRHGVDPGEARGRFHEIKQDDKGRPRDNYGVNPETGEICRPDGEVFDNL